MEATLRPVNPPLRRLLNVAIFISFLAGYLEWGADNHTFIGEMEYELLFHYRNFGDTITHPLILAGLFGQIILLHAAIVPKPNRTIHLAGIIVLSLVMFFILLAGIVSLNWKIMLSTVPFIMCCTLYFLSIKTRKATAFANKKTSL